jgi:ribosomal protein S18 acetylase RimI-like enzyme
MTIEVRPVRDDERAEAGRVTALAYREFVRPGEQAWEDYLSHIADVEDRAERALVLVAVEHGRILGSASLELDTRVEPEDDPPLAPDESHIRMLGVDPDERGKGVARALMDACFDQARARGKRWISLHTTERMRAAQAMYERLGFERKPDRVFPDGFVLLSYEKRIGDGPGVGAGDPP